MRCHAALAVVAAVFGLTAVGSTSPAGAQGLADRYCLQGWVWGYPGNCQFSSYAQCMVTASGTAAGCGINPLYAFAHRQREGYRDDRRRY